MKWKKIINYSIVLFLMLSIKTNASIIEDQKGNGNDGCHIGLPGHDQSDQHKIDWLTEYEWEQYILNNNLLAEKQSNNSNSNGWITYHIYNTLGHQIEVAHLKFLKEIITDGSGEDDFGRPHPEENPDPPTGDGSGEDDFGRPHPEENPDPPTGDGSGEDDFGRPHPEENPDPPTGGGSNEDDLENPNPEEIPKPPTSDGSDENNSGNTKPETNPQPPTDVDSNEDKNVEITPPGSDTNNSLPNTGGVNSILALLSGSLIVLAGIKTRIS